MRRRDGRLAPTGPQQSGGRQKPSFLPREECAGRGPRTACRRGGPRRGRRSAEPLQGQGRPGARPAAKRGRPGGSGTVGLESTTPIGPACGGGRTPHAIRPLARTNGATMEPAPVSRLDDSVSRPDRSADPLWSERIRRRCRAGPKAMPTVGVLRRSWIGAATRRGAGAAAPICSVVGGVVPAIGANAFAPTMIARAIENR